MILIFVFLLFRSLGVLKKCPLAEIRPRPVEIGRCRAECRSNVPKFGPQLANIGPSGLESARFGLISAHVGPCQFGPTSAQNRPNLACDRPIRSQIHPHQTRLARTRPIGQNWSEFDQIWPESVHVHGFNSLVLPPMGLRLEIGCLAILPS